LTHQSLGLVPACLVHQDERRRAGGNRLRDLVPVQGQTLGGAAGQDETSALPLPSALPLRGTDRAEDVSRLGSLIFGGCGSGAALGPAPRDLVLLAHPGLVGEPDLDQLAASLGLRKLLQTGGEVFLKAAPAASFLA
jgi:hypothetical protein